MKILILADVESKYLWDYFDKSKLEGVDLILSCGDLNPQYLSFLASFTQSPVLYVRGNHDDCYEQTPPEGCICIEDKIYTYKGLRIMGLGGSIRYKKGINQYTQRQMQHRVSRMWLQLKCKKGFDILLTHSPAAGINDGFDSVQENIADSSNMQTELVIEELKNRINEDIKARMEKEFKLSVTAECEIMVNDEGEITGVDSVRVYGGKLTDRARSRICEVYGLKPYEVHDE